MSTNSRIGILHSNGHCETIYCHWDGYFSGVGKTLFLHYKTKEKVESLLALGDISSLGTELGEKHSFETYLPEVTTAYHRDRGDCLTPAQKNKSKHELENDAPFIYLFVVKTGKWTCKSHSEPRWRKLTAKLCGANDAPFVPTVLVPVEP